MAGVLRPAGDSRPIRPCGTVRAGSAARPRALRPKAEMRGLRAGDAVAREWAGFARRRRPGLVSRIVPAKILFDRWAAKQSETPRTALMSPLSRLGPVRRGSCG